MTPAPHARIELIPAKEAAKVLVIRRKPSKLFHVLLWDTAAGVLEAGSWFRGKLYAKRCDLSFDGRWMCYLAMGADGSTWNGVSEAPFLKCLATAENTGTWYGGGYWDRAKRLRTNGWGRADNRGVRLLPFEADSGEDLGVFLPRLGRDGWRRAGPDRGRMVKTGDWNVRCVGDDGWEHRPSEDHPRLRVRHLGYEGGYRFGYTLEADLADFDGDVDSAAWDAAGGLVFSRRGVLRRATLEDLRRGVAGETHDLEGLRPPWATSDEVDSATRSHPNDAPR